MLHSIRSLRMQWILIITILSLGSGCTKMLSQQAVSRFSSSLEDKDLPDLKHAVSDRFAERALRREEAIRDLAILKIPTGKAKILEIEEISENESRVKVEVGKKKATSEVVYSLSRNPGSHRWVVDDITLKQDTGRGEVTRSTFEQLDLVMSVRDFVDAWNSQKREEILAVTSPELREQLEPLPETWLVQLASHISAQTPQQKSLRPDARMKDDKAFVQVGSVTVQFQLIENKWYVRDAALKDDENTVRSALKLATALRQSHLFLTAYAAGDKEAIGKVSTSEFHSGCLISADFSKAPIPTEELFSQPYEARQQKNNLDLILKSEQGAVLLSLAFLAKSGSATPEATALPQVYEVTLVEDGAKDSKRISSMFLHETMVNLYSEALVARDVKRLQSMSTLDFRERVWDRLRPDIVKALPLPEIEAATPEIFNVSYSGATTEVTVTQGTRALTYVMQSTPGHLEIADVLIPTDNRPSSLKTTVEHLIPVYEFVAGFAGNNVNRIRQCSAESFNNMIWTQLSEVPPMEVDPVALLTLPLTAMQVNQTSAVLRFGDDRQGAQVQINREDGQVRIHDMTLVTGTQPGDRVELLASMRRMITNGLSSDGKIMQAKAESFDAIPMSLPKASRRIQQPIEVQ